MSVGFRAPTLWVGVKIGEPPEMALFPQKTAAHISSKTYQTYARGRAPTVESCEVKGHQSDRFPLKGRPFTGSFFMGAGGGGIPPPPPSLPQPP